jgi:hypothetical protein
MISNMARGVPRYFIIVTVLALWCWCAGTPVALADSTTETLNLIVQDQTGAPVPYAHIDLVNLSLITHETADAQATSLGRLADRERSPSPASALLTRDPMTFTVTASAR